MFPVGYSARFSVIEYNFLQLIKFLCVSLSHCSERRVLPLTVHVVSRDVVGRLVVVWSFL